MSSPILVAGELRHKKIKLLASGHLQWDREAHVSFSDRNTDKRLLHSTQQAGQAAGDSVQTGTCAQGPFGTQLPWDTRNPPHLLFISNTLLPDYTAPHASCSHTHQEHEV